MGHEVESAADAPEALALVKIFKPEVAILDIGLPVMDGYELASQLRVELADCMPRLVALTGYGQQNDRERSTNAGFDVHLIKHVDAQVLISSIAAG